MSSHITMTSLSSEKEKPTNMKNIKNYIGIIVFVLAVSAAMLISPQAMTQTPPPPNGGNTGSGGTTPVGGGAAIGSGLIIMMAAAGIYAGKQYFRKE